MRDAEPAPARERLVVVWRVTTHCNLGCRFCAYDRRLQRARSEVEPSRIRRFARVLAEYSSVNQRPVHLSFLGGEPLLFRPLVDLEPELFAAGISLGVTTNGSVASNDVRRRLLRYYDELTVSVDSPGVGHDVLRAWPGGFQRLAALVPELASARRRSGPAGCLPLIRVNTVLMRRTLGHFRRLCLEVAGWGVDEVTFNELGGRDRPEFHAGERLLAQQLVGLSEAVPFLRAELRRRGTTLRGAPRYLERLRFSAEGRPWPIDDCRPADRLLFVDELGRISPCSFTSDDYSVSIDEVRGPRELADLPRRFSAQRASRAAPACRDCRATHVFSKFEPSRPAPSRAAHAGEEARSNANINE